MDNFIGNMLKFKPEYLKNKVSNLFISFYHPEENI